VTPDYEAPSGVYDGALSGPPELVLALSAADSATGATIDQRALLATLGLLDGEALLDPVEHHESDRREHGAQREEVWVGVLERDPQEEVRGDADREEVGAVSQAERADLL